MDIGVQKGSGGTCVLCDVIETVARETRECSEKNTLPRKEVGWSRGESLEAQRVFWLIGRRFPGSFVQCVLPFVCSTCYMFKVCACVEGTVLIFACVSKFVFRGFQGYDNLVDFVQRLPGSFS